MRYIEKKNVKKIMLYDFDKLNFCCKHVPFC